MKWHPDKNKENTVSGHSSEWGKIPPAFSKMSVTTPRAVLISRINYQIPVYRYAYTPNNGHRCEINKNIVRIERSRGGEKFKGLAWALGGHMFAWVLSRGVDSKAPHLRDQYTI